jgi:hypothetical protein
MKLRKFILRHLSEGCSQRAQRRVPRKLPGCSDHRRCANSRINTVIDTSSTFHINIHPSAVTMVVHLHYHKATGIEVNLLPSTHLTHQRILIIRPLLWSIRVRQTTRILQIPRLLLRWPSPCISHRSYFRKRKKTTLGTVSCICVTGWVNCLHRILCRLISITEDSTDKVQSTYIISPIFIGTVFG